MIDYIHIAQFLCALAFAPIVSLTIWGFYFASRDGFALFRLRTTVSAFCAALRLSWLANPTVECPLCMASVWSAGLGIPFALWVLNLGWLPILCGLPVFALVVAGLNGIVSEWREGIIEVQGIPIQPYEGKRTLPEVLNELALYGIEAEIHEMTGQFGKYPGIIIALNDNNGERDGAVNIVKIRPYHQAHAFAIPFISDENKA